MKDYTKYGSRDPYPGMPYKKDPADALPGIVAVVMLLIALTLWVSV